MRLEHFQYIVEIARCKSMSKASKKLFITQPSLSTAIQGLETELGFQIFKRSASGVALTDKGDILHREYPNRHRITYLPGIIPHL